MHKFFGLFNLSEEYEKNHKTNEMEKHKKKFMFDEVALKRFVVGG